MLLLSTRRFVGLKEFGTRAGGNVPKKQRPGLRQVSQKPEVDSDEEEEQEEEEEEEEGEEVLERSFWHTTGMYPQSMVLSFERRVRLCQLELNCSDVTRASGLYEDGWKELAVLESGRHRLKFKRQKATCLAVRLTVDASSTNTFSFVKSIRLVGYSSHKK